MKNISNNRWLTIISILLLLANAVTLTLLWTNKSRHPRKDAPAIPPPPPGGQVFEFITNELKLSTQQQEAYKVLREEHQAAQRVLQDSIRKSKDVFFGLLPNPAVNDSLLQKLSEKGLAFQQQLELLTFRHFQKLRALCTAEQQKRFDEIIKEVLLQMSGPRMHPPGPPPPGQDFRGDGPPPRGDMPPPPKENM